jgi:hypothetical protein
MTKSTPSHGWPEEAATVATSDWTIAHGYLLGQLANCKELLESLVEDADLDEIEESIDSLQSSIRDASSRMEDAQEEEDEDE